MSKETKYGIAGAVFAVIGMALIVALVFLLPVVAMKAVAVVVPMVGLAFAGWAIGKEIYYDRYDR